jgi:response regulator RpfG family c-di-GMP phosphodiesterase
LNLTLLVENNPKIESFYKLNLSTWLGLETLTQKNGEAAVQYLSTQSAKINLIIVRYNIGKEQTAAIISAFVKKKALNIPIIVIGPGEVPDVLCVVNSLDLKLMIKTAAVALNITAKEMSSKTVPDFFPIPLIYFNSIKRSVCPIYAQNVDDPQKYHLQIDKLMEFDEEMLFNLTQEKVMFLYVDKMDRLNFVSNVTAELISELKVDDLSEDENISAVDMSMELLSKKLLRLGINEETVNLAKKNIAAIALTAKKSNNLSKLLGRLLNNKASYLYKHTQILTYVCFHIIHNIDWGSPEQEEKISFIAFFHDIALENDVQCQIHTTVQLKNSLLTKEDKELVEKHAQIAAEYITKFPHAPMGADQIIRQHHGQLHGLGFSDHYGANISPMAMVFIVAEEFTRIIMDQKNENINRDSIIDKLKKEFTSNRFLKIIEKLESITL